ncbi:MAG TPA: 5'-nucleotidase C-terminal domain-containing protein, partial [Methylomirabilota bacterium]|nr:5'-nucleotidase C-terminal domain-containing protein [Methylomirabilota bacterium]
SAASTLLRGQHMIAGMNAIGLDLATFGNHEFDFGPALLAERMRESTFTWLSANVLDRRLGRPFGGARADLVLTLAGVRVGLFGLTLPDTARTSNPGPDVEFHDPIATARAISADMRKNGVQLIVALTHQDMAADRATARAADLDVVLGGHEHEPLVAEEGKALITKAGSDARYLVQIDLWFASDGRLRERSWTFHEVSARLPDDPEAARVVAAYAERLGRELDIVVGHTATPLDARRAPLRTQETNIGDFVADVIRAHLKTDVALMNGGGIRSDRIVPAGPLTRRDVISLVPFNNVVVVLEMTGARLREALEFGLVDRERQGGQFLQVSGLALTFDPGRPPGDRIVSAQVGGAPLASDARYRVAVIDFLARGGGGITAFRDARVLTGYGSGPLLSEIVLSAITAAGTIAPEVDGRQKIAR